MGWGPGEMGDYNYWGGNDDYVELFKSEGFNIIEVSVGPVSSNWERAIEVYYQLKGGQVDYGKFHSNQHGIIQLAILPMLLSHLFLIYISYVNFNLKSNGLLL